MATSSDLLSAPPTKPLKPASRWEDFIDIFYAPGAVFRRRENQSVWPPFIVVTVLRVAVVYFTFGALSPIIEGDVSRATTKAMQANPQMTQQASDLARSIGLGVARWGGFIEPLLILSLGLAMWLVGKLFDSRQSFQAAIMVAAYVGVIGVLEYLANGIQGLVLDMSKATSMFKLSLGPARMFDVTTTSPVLFTLLVRLNVFVLWRTVLVGIGVYATGRVSKTSAIAIAFIVWLLASLFQIRQIISIH